MCKVHLNRPNKTKLVKHIIFDGRVIPLGNFRKMQMVWLGDNRVRSFYTLSGFIPLRLFDFGLVTGAKAEELRLYSDCVFCHLKNVERVLHFGSRLNLNSYIWWVCQVHIIYQYAYP